MAFIVVKDVLLVLVLIHAIKMFKEEGPRSEVPEQEKSLTCRRRFRLLVTVLVQLAWRSAPIGYYGLELFDRLVA